jgi:putative acyl-CoA dehydrogenase
MSELAQSAAQDPRLRLAHDGLQEVLHEPRLLDVRARSLLESLAKTAAGAILRAHAPREVADAFIASRLGGSARHTYGQAIERADAQSILDRALPA